MIYLRGVRFTSGITFDFTGSTPRCWLPGEHVVLVKNSAAFGRTLHGRPTSPAQYTGSLDNSGERFVLRGRQRVGHRQFHVRRHRRLARAAPMAAARALVIVNPAVDPNDPNNWRSSTEYGGSPGAVGLGRRSTRSWSTKCSRTPIRRLSMRSSCTTRPTARSTSPAGT